MRFVDEFRDPQAARGLVATIHALATTDTATPLSYMEICGGHTHTIYRHGLEHLLPETVRLVHGPGCPVCVIPMGRIDDAIWLAEQPDVTLVTFGDLLRVPGSRGSLLEAKARGADVRFVYSPLDALTLAQALPQRHVVFFAVGFETTAPATSATLLQARQRRLTNFSVFSNHVRIQPPIRAILDSPDLQLDGFVGPGHVATVVGTRVFDLVADAYRRPVVVAGFEPLDILQAIAMLLTQRRDGRCQVENQYTRVVRPDGNPAALRLMETTLRVRDFAWRGLGEIPHSGLGVHPDFADLDAEERFEIPGRAVPDPAACQCGQVLRGALRPWECKVFGTACTPQTPIGTCMVSTEGACAAYYTYGRLAPTT